MLQLRSTARGRGSERRIGSGVGQLAFLLGKTLGLVLDIDSYLLQRRQVLSAVVGAKKQLTRVWE